MEREILIALLTANLTLIGGLALFIATQLLLKFIIEPIYEQKKIISEIIDTVVFYSNVIGAHSSLNDKSEQAAAALRSLATRLRARTHFIPFYSSLAGWGWVLPLERVETAAGALIGLSNSVYDRSFSHINRFKVQIAEALEIKFGS
jgi:hypothetical protein